MPHTRESRNITFHLMQTKGNQDMLWQDGILWPFFKAELTSLPEILIPNLGMVGLIM